MATLTAEDGLAVQTDEISDPRVLRIQHLIVNSYMIHEPSTGTWALVDMGLAPFSAGKIIRAAEKRFGYGVRPAAIILTHGHFDHVGAAYQLVRYWNVPVYAHELELPFLTGRSAYPPPDPTVGGGLMARMAGFMPRRPINLEGHVMPLPSDGVVPFMPGWRWIHTPGHSPGHISLFRYSDGMLIAGDAFVTVKQESLLSVLSQNQQVSRPPAYFTPDWAAAHQSLKTLLALEPSVGATGHGVPMAGQRLKDQLRALVDNFEAVMPAKGRYVYEPARADASGVVSVPPPVPDPFPKLLAASFIGAALVLMATRARKRRNHRSPDSDG